MLKNLCENTDMKMFCVKKGVKYLKGWHYATGVGYKYQWTKVKSEAKNWIETTSDPDHFAKLVKGKVIEY